MIRETRESASGTITNDFAYGLDLSGSMQGAGTIGGILIGEFDGTVALMRSMRTETSRILSTPTAVV